MSLDRHTSEISRQLIRFSDEISIQNSLNRNSDAVDAENLFRDFLNLVFSWKLKNSNEDTMNQGFYDLEDEKRKICVQVTSTKQRKKKIESVIDGFRKNQLYNKFDKVVVLFVTAKCDNVYLKKKGFKNFVYEGYDIAKLVKYIYYNKSHVEKEQLRHFLEGYAGSSTQQKVKRMPSFDISVLKGQAQPIKKGSFYIRRPELVKKVFSFCQEQNGLLTGGPGAGKSFVIEEVHRYLWSKKATSCIIRINELIKGNDEEIGRELKLGPDWIEQLKAIPQNNHRIKNVLFFDAFDTAKNEALKSEILWQIKKSIELLKDGWIVIASCRAYDAQKSTSLRNLFPQQSMQNPLYCRHYEILGFTQDEVENEIAKNKPVFRIYKGCTKGLQQLLRTPFFLKIFESILASSDINRQRIEAIETEEQLLKIFWEQKTADDISKEVFLTHLTKKLSANFNLSCKKTDVINEANTKVADALISEGIIVPTGSMKQNISFAHNILFDYAFARLQICSDVGELLNEIRSNEKLPFVYRSGFIYFYSRLWQQQRDEFWNHYDIIRAIQTPVFRLFLQTVLNSVLVSIYKSENDLSPIFLLEDATERSMIIKRMLDGLRFTNRDHIRDQDFHLFYHLSSGLHPNFLWELGRFIDQAINVSKEENNKQKFMLMGKAARNYFEFILNQRAVLPEGNRFDGSLAHWGILNLSRTFASNKTACRKLIRRSFSLLDEPDFPIPYFHSLSDKVEHFVGVDPTFVSEVYKKIYLHTENSDKETHMGTAVIGLRSNRRQDFGSCYYGLENFYPKFLREAPVQALETGIAIVDYGLNTKSKVYGMYNAFPLKIFGANVKVVSDYARYEPDDEQDHGLCSHVHNAFQYLQELADAQRITEVNKLLKLICVKAKSFQWWRGVLRFLANNAPVTHKIAKELLVQPVVYACDEIEYETGELIKSSWSYFDNAVKRKIEESILLLKRSKYAKYDYEDFREGKVKVFLGCIPNGKAIVPATKKFIREKGTFKNEPPHRGPVLANVGPVSRDEKLLRLGIKEEDSADKLLYAKIENLESFNSIYDSNKATTPESKDYQPYIDLVIELFEQSKGIADSKKDFRHHCENEISRFAEIISRDAENLNTEARTLSKQIGFYYLHKNEYLPASYQSEDEKRFISWTPSPRTSAAMVLVQLLHTDAEGDIEEEVLKMVEDSSNVVRWKALNYFTHFWHKHRDLFWETCLRRLKEETDAACYTVLLRNVCYHDIIDADVNRVEEAVSLASTKSIKTDSQSGLMKQYLVALLRLVIYKKSPLAKKLLYKGFSHQSFASVAIFQIFSVIDPRREGVDYTSDPQLYEDLFEMIHSILDLSFSHIKTKGLNSGDLKEDFGIIDKVVQQIFFKTKYRQKETERKLNEAEKLAFFERVKPIMNKILEESTQIGNGFMLAHTGYYFIQVLNDFLSLDPAYVLGASKVMVDCAARDGFTYDSSIVKEIVQLTEQVLANHKGILADANNFNNLLSILDHFANSGWIEALELIWRLKEIF